MKVIIALTHNQYILCLHQKCWRQSEVPFINRPDQLKGLSNIEPFFFGDYWKNPLWPQIDNELRARGIKDKHGHHVNLDNLGSGDVVNPDAKNASRFGK